MILVFENKETSGVSVFYPAPGVKLTKELIKQIVPEDCKHKNIQPEALPDQTFRDAWVLLSTKVSVDINKAKDLAHARRRQAREEAFRPYDEIIAKRIPGTDEAAAEAAREAVREKFNQIQQRIDSAKDVAGLKLILEEEGI